MEIERFDADGSWPLICVIAQVSRDHLQTTGVSTPGQGLVRVRPVDRGASCTRGRAACQDRAHHGDVLS